MTGTGTTPLVAAGHGAPYSDEATRALHEAPCPGCGCEPEVVAYYRRGPRRVGFHCTCGAVVIDGLAVMNDPFTR
jgi:hypothetical protein